MTATRNGETGLVMAGWEDGENPGILVEIGQEMAADGAGAQK
jgi:hypothetical protein